VGEKEIAVDFHDIPFEFYIILSIIFWVVVKIVYVLLKSDLVEEVESENKYQISSSNTSLYITSHFSEDFCSER
jgi:hypothetical protein